MDLGPCPICGTTVRPASSDFYCPECSFDVVLSCSCSNVLTLTKGKIPKFCSECGKPVDIRSVQRSAFELLCSNTECSFAVPRKPNGSLSKFCTDCGTGINRSDLQTRPVAIDGARLSTTNSSAVADKERLQLPVAGTTVTHTDLETNDVHNVRILRSETVSSAPAAACHAGAADLPALATSASEKLTQAASERTGLPLVDSVDRPEIVVSSTSVNTASDASSGFVDQRVIDRTLPSTSSVRMLQLPSGQTGDAGKNFEKDQFHTGGKEVKFRKEVEVITGDHSSRGASAVTPSVTFIDQSVRRRREGRIISRHVAVTVKVEALPDCWGLLPPPDVPNEAGAMKVPVIANRFGPERADELVDFFEDQILAAADRRGVLRDVMADFQFPEDNLHSRQFGLPRVTFDEDVMLRTRDGVSEGEDTAYPDERVVLKDAPMRQITGVIKLSDDLSGKGRRRKLMHRIRAAPHIQAPHMIFPTFRERGLDRYDPVSSDEESDDFHELVPAQSRLQRTEIVPSIINRENVDVYFHVTIVESFRFDENSDQPFIELYSSRPDDKPIQRPLEFHNLPSGRPGWMVPIRFSQELCNQVQPLQYRYFIKHNSASAFEDTYEWIYKHAEGDACLKRQFRLSDIPADQDKWDQYDLVMLPNKYRPNDSKSGQPLLLQNVVNGDTASNGNLYSRLFQRGTYALDTTDRTVYNSIMSATVIGLESMLPDFIYCISNGNMKGNQVIECFCDVIRCVVKGNLYFLDETGHSVDKECFRLELLKQLVQRARQQEQLSRQAIDQPVEFDKHLRLRCIASGLVLIALAHRFRYANISEHIPGILASLNISGLSQNDIHESVQYHFTNVPAVVTPLRHFMMETARSGSPSWLCALPLFHVLQRWARTYNRRICKYNTPHWWGLDGELYDCIPDFLAQAREFKTKEWYQLLSPMFGVSWLSARTFVGALSNEQLLSALSERFPLPVDSYIAAILLKCFSENSQQLKPEECVEAVDCLLKILNEAPYSTADIATTETAAPLLNSMEIIVAALCQAKVIEFRGWQLILKIVQLFAALCARLVLSKDRPFDSGLVARFFDAVLEWLSFVLPSRVADTDATTLDDPSELEMWQLLFALTWNDKEICDAWMKKLQEQLLHRLEKVSQFTKVALYCLTDFRNGYIEELFSTIALEAADDVMRNPAKEINYHSNDKTLEKYGKVFSFGFNKAWNRHSTDSSKKLEFMFTWPSFPTYIELKCLDCAVLDETCRGKIDECVKLLKEHCSVLRSGNITYSELCFVIEHSSRLTDIFRRLYDGLLIDEKDASDIEKFLEVRTREKVAFDELHDSLSIFITLCERIDQVQLNDLPQRVNADLSKKPLHELWVPKPERHGGLECRHFPVTKTILTPDLLRLVKKVHVSLLFMSYWTNAAKQFMKEREQTGQSIDLKDVTYIIWEQAHRHYTDFVNRLVQGIATFEDADYLIKQCDTESHNVDKQISNEVEHLTQSSQNWKDVAQRVVRYNKLKLYATGATRMRDLKDHFKLQGDFSDLEVLITWEQNPARKLYDITDKLVGAGKRLEAMADPLKVDCLTAFVECREFTDWVKVQVAEPKELKVFVELAGIVAGEGDIAVEQVRCLYDAFTGYSPLIYELPESADLQLFLEKCEAVWKSLETNKNLATQLRDSARNIQFFKRVKDSYSSVELTSLAQAEVLNDEGLYTVGFVSHMKSGHQTNALDSVVQALVPDKRQQRVSPSNNDQPTHASPIHAIADDMTVAEKKYTYTALSELQSKLMLVAGQAERGNREVEEFVKMFGNVTRLAQAFVRANEVGTILFEKWRLEFMNEVASSEETTKSYTRVSFGFSRETANVIQCRCDRAERAAHAAELAAFLEGCVGKWERYIRQQRQKYHELNFFTTRQIVFLRKELAKCLELNSIEKKCSNLIYPLLAMLVRCDWNDIEEALRATCQQALDSQSEKPHGVEVIHSTLTMECNQTSFADLLSVLRTRWKEFLSGESSDAREFLSMERLGDVLRHLSAKNAKASSTVRKPQHGFSDEQLHLTLIVCPEDEILHAVLSLHVVRPERKMPTRNEVLVCTEQTSLEEVELLLQRAVVDPASLYTIAYAHRLNYDICGHIEERIEDFKTHENKYCIAVVCAEESEDSSRITTALERFRARRFVIEPLKKLQDFVQEHLSVPKDSGAVSAGGVVDAKRCAARVIRSHRAGLGKTLFVRRRISQLESKLTTLKPALNVQLLQQRVDVSSVVRKFLDKCDEPENYSCRLIHINIAQEVHYGVNELLFNLLILGSLCHPEGYVWQRSQYDYYAIEMAPVMKKNIEADKVQALHSVIELLPTLSCASPKQCHQFYSQPTASGPTGDVWQEMDDQIFRSKEWQRTYQYLKRHKSKDSYSGVNASNPEDTPKDMLHLLLDECKLEDPSWSELRHFVNFLSTQLLDCERSVFCNVALHEDLPGFLEFVVLFMLLMSREFATRSLFNSKGISDDQLSRPQYKSGESLLGATEKMQRWECSAHPYIFFNADHETLTFLGFCIDRRKGHILVPRTGDILLQNAVASELFAGLDSNRVELWEDFDSKSREDKIQKLCAVMGNGDATDPDSTYELTLDNAKKILAIHMRFRCGIPVVIMGETGCGKTRLVKFMCDLQITSKQRKTTKNLILMKVHGGTTAQHVEKRVREAQELAKENIRFNIDTILFFDEANTTDAIGLIKEVMCDDSLHGEPLLANDIRLRFIAAVNPYRKHSRETIEQLEKAGLGYNVKADETLDKFGSIPMRHLVYRVRALPESMIPLVWDFGSLRPDVEKKYVCQMIKHYALPGDSGIKDAIAGILVKCQEFMRAQKDECSFVSLRDIDRVLRVMSWFHDKHELLQQRVERSPESSLQQVHSDSMINDSEEQISAAPLSEVSTVSQSSLLTLDPVTWSLVLALGVCYHACLQPRKRIAFRRHVGSQFRHPLVLPHGDRQILDEIEKCQKVILQSLNDLPSTNFALENIAGNHALKENIFVMVVCLELRIPLFIIGKPGSSKSLAKAIVQNAMQGRSPTSKLFQNLKEVYMVSFQCSPLATPEGIVGTFKYCASFQKSKDLNKFVSVVVLDEVGLAEDSKLMPLKALHPLLEEGCDVDEKPEPYMKCAFIGISNWALDPAKMNRGIRVQRGVPDKVELENTARGICTYDQHSSQAILKCIGPLAAAYMKILDDLSARREFFGLRDFYSLMKMVAYFASKRGGMPTPYELRHAILRNFGGVERLDALKTFEKHLRQWLQISADTLPRDNDPPIDAIGLIDSSLTGVYTKKGGESRYLLVITENDTALSLVQSKLHKSKPEVIFGSNFPKDLQYTQVCRNINRIKVCMEAGKTLILLNLENLYESLYDALNQYYVYLGGKRFVDLGLGTHRVKCRVDENFRLIVIADKEAVLTRFPIPLINRLEKHYVEMSSLLSERQQVIAQRLCRWASKFVQMTQPVAGLLKEQPSKDTACTQEDAFVGYSTDGVAAVILQIHSDFLEHSTDNEQIFKRAREILLLSATPDAVLRVKKSPLSGEYSEIFRTYFKEQRHSDFIDLLSDIVKQRPKEDLFWQVTTHYRLLSRDDVSHIKSQLGSNFASLEVIYALQAVDTEQQFSRDIRDFYQCTDNSGLDSLLIVQCEAGHDNVQLISCARYIIWREYNDSLSRLESPNISETPLPTPGRHGMHHVVLLVQLQRKAKFIGFQGSHWTCIHVENLHLRRPSLPTMEDVHEKCISDILNSGTSAELQEISSHVVTNDTELPKETPFNTYELLQSCLHEAVSRLTDVSDGRSIHAETLGKAKTRSRARLKLLIDLFSSQPSPVHSTFMKLFSDFLIRLMNMHENDRVAPEMRDQWLFVDAASIQNVIKFGTFRRSLENCLERRIAPFFATIVAFLDTNCNLDLLALPASTDDHWVSKLWLDIFTGVSGFSSDVARALASTGVQKCEVPVICTSASNESFSPRFPFSWLLKGQLDAMILRFKYPTETFSDVHEQMCTWLSTDRTFDCVTHEASEQQAKMVERYLHDFVHLAFPCKQSRPEFHKIMTISLRQVMLATSRQTIPGIHLCSFEIQRRTERLRKLIDLQFPDPLAADCIPLEKEVLSYVEAQALETSEMVSDLAALQLSLDRLDPSKSKKELGDWAAKMHKYRMLAEEVLSDVSNDKHEDIERPALWRICRDQWWRYLVLLLFLEMVINRSRLHPDLSQLLDDDTVKVLSQRLVGKSNFKQIAALKNLEEFLEYCNKKVVTSIFGKRFLDTACCCGQHALEDPTILPCQHPICGPCLQLVVCNQKEESRCPLTTCNQRIPPEFARLPRSDFDDEYCAKVERHKIFKQLLNSFFVRVLVDLVFSGKDPPDAVVLQHILRYVTSEHHTDGRSSVHTKQLSPFRDITLIDLKPVIRSFLLQQLLRTSEVLVKEHLSQYFKAMTTLTENLGSHVCILFITCFEDYVVEKTLGNNTTSTPLAVSYEACAYVRDTLDPNRQTRLIFDGGMAVEVDSLRAIAALRLCLTIGADVICKHLLTMPQRSTNRDFFTISQLLSDICDYAENNGNSWPRRFLAKQIVRKYGATVFHAASSAEHLRYIIPKELEQTAGRAPLPDLFVIGLNKELYEEIRSAVSHCIRDAKMDALLNVIKGRQSAEAETDMHCVLAMCSEFVRMYFEANSATCLGDEVTPSAGITEEVKDMVELYTAQQWPEAKVLQHLVAGIVKNSLADKLRIATGSSVSDMMVLMLVQRLAVGLLFKERGSSSIVNPLVKIIATPLEMQTAYFPTMPHDPLLEVKEVIKNTSSANEDLLPYACLNGHIYYTGDCGRSDVLSKCPECGSGIGSEKDITAKGNRCVNLGEDNTKPGHILGLAAATNQVITERNLTPQCCIILRAVLHIALYVSAIVNGKEQVEQLVHPRPENLLQFLWNHLTHDIKCLQSALSKSFDDCLVFLHTVVAQLVISDEEDDCNWSSHDGRRAWENKVQKCLLLPSSQEADGIIAKGTAALHSNVDGGTAAKALAGLIDEIHTIESDAANQSSVANLSSLLNSAAVWCYRENPSVERFINRFENSNSFDASLNDERSHKYSALKLFLRYRVQLAAVRFLPDILSLISSVSREFGCKIDMAAANDLNIGQFLRKHVEDRQSFYRPLLDSFYEAWNAVSARLEQHTFWYRQRRFNMPTEHCAWVKASDASPLCMLLPGMSGLGLCSLTLVTYLAKVQNDFLSEYAYISRERLHEDIPLLSVVPVQLIVFSGNEDLLPIIRANCEYSLEAGKDISLQYNFESIQTHIIDRFVRHKSQISLSSEQNGVGAIQCFYFREDLRNGNQFEKLHKNLTQKPLPLQLKESMQKECRGKVSELSDMLVVIDKAVGFLVTSAISEDSNISLVHYLQTVLQMPDINADVMWTPLRENCYPCHIRALWLLLSLERAKELTKNRQECFDDLDAAYCQPIGEQETAAMNLTKSLKKHKHDMVVEIVSEILYEFIVLELACKRRKPVADFDADEGISFQPTFSLFSTLSEYAEKTVESTGIDEAAIASMKKLGHQYPALLLRHSAAVWKKICDL